MNLVNPQYCQSMESRFVQNLTSVVCLVDASGLAPVQPSISGFALPQPQPFSWIGPVAPVNHVRRLPEEEKSVSARHLLQQLRLRNLRRSKARARLSTGVRRSPYARIGGLRIE